MLILRESSTSKSLNVKQAIYHFRKRFGFEIKIGK